jgi:hypothetical protein
MRSELSGLWLRTSAHHRHLRVVVRGRAGVSLGVIIELFEDERRPYWTSSCLTAKFGDLAFERGKPSQEGLRFL